MRTRILSSLAIAVVATPMLAADDPLDAFPADTGVVLRIASPSELTTKVRTFLNKAAPQYALLAEQIGPGLGSLTGNPTLAGVDANSDWYVAVRPRREGPPGIVYAAGASDVAQLKQAVGERYATIEHGDWFLYSLDNEAISASQSRINGEGKSIREAIPKTLDPPFGKGDISVFLNVPVLRDAYREQIEADRERFLDEISKDQQAPADGPDPRARFVELYTQTIEDAVAVCASFSIGGDALQLDGAAIVTADSPSSKRLAEIEPSELPLLAKLPQGQLVYFSASSSTIAFYQSALKFLEPVEDEINLDSPIAKALLAQKFRGVALSAGDKESGGPVTLLMDVEKPDELRKEFLEFMKSDKLGSPEQQAKVTLGTDQIDGIDADVVNVEQEPDSEQDTDAGALETLIAERSKTGYLGVADGIVVMTNRKDAMSQAIGTIRKKPAGDAEAQAAFEKTRSSLDDKLNLLFVADFPRLFLSGLELAIENGSSPLPIGPEALEGIDLPPSYAAASTSVKPTELHGRLVIPVEQVAGLVKFYETVQQAGPAR